MRLFLDVDLDAGTAGDGGLDLGDGVARDVRVLAAEVELERTGALGFCLGGSLAYNLAAVGDPDAVVSFRGFTAPVSGR
ncbi:MAG TPA: dienelactone hydrolase family protein [Kutzneria sp.]|jgi:carboxymethylenebutenolidase